MEKLKILLGSFLPFPYNLGFHSARFYKFILRTQYWSREELEAFQIKRLQEILAHATRNVPYYRKLFRSLNLTPDDFKSIRDLENIPILTKEDVKRLGSELYAENRDRFSPSFFQTGGSTGTPLEFLIDKHMKRVSSAFVWRFRKNFASFTPKDRLLVIRYRDLSHIKTSPPYEIVKNTLYISAFHLKKENLKPYLEIIRDFKPKASFVFPSAMYVFARYMEKHGMIGYAPVPIITTSSETLYRPHRELIEKAFNGRIFDWYGSNEDVISAGECECGNMHINAEYGIVEIVDKDGRRLKEGEKGIVVGTCLWRMAMPFIRYKIGDYASFSWERCRCGRTLPLLKELEGRLEDIIVTKDHRLVGRLDEAFHYSPGIARMQIVQDVPGKIRVKVVKDDDFSDRDIETLSRELRARLGEDMELEYEFVQDIPLTERGKFRAVVSNLKIEEFL